ncbi:hypothetical protein A1OE_294 [Candidatus Endolissoclinum faulkneri L2]|uniref:Uncharacterized protein n=1 Tax=Candidatus Endolissoclinum faulkneri L2 TaxID=1193729 RepID=K7YPK3_9PROT|nr:hypothetical protein A1OE_294 [Candidatus Endolissoclinum faulkneri L2]
MFKITISSKWHPKRFKIIQFYWVHKILLNYIIYMKKQIIIIMSCLLKIN